MNLYEVIRWGNESDDPFTGGANGLDTCFLVRAESVEQAGQLADAVLRTTKGELAKWAEVIHLLGAEQSAQRDARVLRGPYLQHAYRHGWRHWTRPDAVSGWIEQT
ncbi:hypothetical protein [Cupriavidus pauculus]|uniref:hypothetical protein n=1 Tax=Cupriavidus pauculus TaxID=82633 RepID=UPI001EE1DE46|nr:hypothetical protein [Cupriavidus pauculus]GJG97658.1 hypothetical protein CBA19C6_24235 [Cupriavidus pauculus]